ncbi:xanthine dehydrogenase subunit D [Paenibacillus sp. P96]|uniref:Xanthine dehydrogenase subunit D n=1 Tax=Paenibacillus zeirhizosphaerae TaxID=2987519 RepID=A0ABT9FW23_9BACL|nr:xanthine dehydrogenase subunit D [Paenibacillus sp. P96]MDP4098726.1 xanthine dehydrogenase subunit D [Paenibacillus sp. P96]
MLLNRENSGKRWYTRPDGPDKVAGKLQYLTDLSLPGMLYGRVLRSMYPHARILSVDTSAAERLEGVQAVLTYRDVPGMNLFGLATPDQPVFCSTVVRYTGDAIAAIAAESPQIAEAALLLISVEYEELPVMDSPETALAPDAILLHSQGNVLHRTEVKRGSVEEAFRTCAHMVEETYYTPRQMHTYMETEGGLFVPEADGRLTVYAATQHGYKDRLQLSRILDMPEESIRVISSPIGGSFGGKDELNVQPYGSLLALRCGRPVKMHNSRKESVRAGLKRHPMKIEMRTGTDANGKLLAHQVRITADTGAYATLGAPVLNFATEHSMGPYNIPHVDIEGVSVYTNNGVSGEFRGFGGNQAIFAMEGQMDRLAGKLGMDPWEFRRLNLRASSDPGPLGQRILQTEGLAQVWEAVEKSELWQQRKQGLDRQEHLPWVQKGIGAAIAMHGAGLGYGIPDPAGGRLSLTIEGKIEAAFSYEEFGQGLVATLEIMLMDIFACTAEDLSIVIGDTDRVPHSGSSTASRSTTMAWMALQRLRTPFISKIRAIATRLTGIPEERLVTGPGGIWQMSAEHGGDCNTTQEFSGIPLVTYAQIAAAAGEELIFDTKFDYPTTPDHIVGGHYLYTYAAVITEVEVNTLSGEVRLLDTKHVVAAGPVINPMGYLGQIEGGSVMALGFTLTEDAIMAGGRYLTPNLDTYMIPTISDVHTSLEVEAIQELPEGDPFGPRGIGEIGSVALAPAIAAAIHQATGVRVNRLPVSRELLLRPVELAVKEGAER